MKAFASLFSVLVLSAQGAAVQSAREAVPPADEHIDTATVTIRFKDGYLNRRINVTMLFGQHGRDDPAQN